MDLPGEFKQELVRAYNLVNREIFDLGTKRVRVECAGQAIVILAEHRRTPVQLVMDRRKPELARLMDVVLIDEFKARLKAEIARRLDIKVGCVLKDYDPEREIAGTILVLED